MITVVRILLSSFTNKRYRRSTGSDASRKWLRK